jgi:hypothetical protein
MVRGISLTDLTIRKGVSGESAPDDRRDTCIRLMVGEFRVSWRTVASVYTVLTCHLVRKLVDHLLKKTDYETITTNSTFSLAPVPADGLLSGRQGPQ